MNILFVAGTILLVLGAVSVSGIMPLNVAGYFPLPDYYPVGTYYFDPCQQTWVSLPLFSNYVLGVPTGTYRLASPEEMGYCSGGITESSGGQVVTATQISDTQTIVVPTITTTTVISQGSSTTSVIVTSTTITVPSTTSTITIFSTTKTAVTSGTTLTQTVFNTESMTVTQTQTVNGDVTTITSTISLTPPINIFNFLGLGLIAGGGGLILLSQKKVGYK